MLAVVVVGLTSFLIGGRLRNRVLFATPRKAFSVESVESYTRSNRPPRERQRLFAVRSDGSFLDASRRIDGQKMSFTKSVTLIPERRYVVVSDPIQSMSTFYLSEAQALSKKAGPGDPTCSTKSAGSRQYVVKGRDSILGYEVVILEDNAGTERWESWEAPGLDCFPLRTVVEFKRPDPSLTDRTESIAVKVTLGEPPSELFAIPAHYTERPPSQMNIESALLETGIVPQFFVDAAQRMDRNYYASRRNMPR